MASFTIPSFVLVAEAVRRDGRAKFDCLRPLLSLAPQLIAVFLVKSILVGIGSILLFVPGVYLFTIWAFAEVIATVEKKTFWESLESSRLLVRGNWFPVFGLVAVALIIVFAGVMLLGVGMLVSVPLGTLVVHAAYRDIRAQSGMISSKTPEIIDAEIVT